MILLISRFFIRLLTRIVKSELIDYICEYSFGTELAGLAGQIGADIQF